MTGDKGPLLIVATAARALAQQARRAGYRPLVLDAFGDTDTKAAAERAIQVPCDARLRFEPLALQVAARSLAPPEIPLVWGSGLEEDTGLLAELQAGRPAFGTPAQAVASCKDPILLASVLRDLGLPHPETRLDAPTLDVQDWVIKATGGTGAAHVRSALGRKAKPGRYFQRRVPGRPISALLLCGRQESAILGWSEQWVERHGRDRRRFLGLAAPMALPPDLAPAMAQAALAAAGAFDLQGLVSVDFLAEADRGFHLLELNPRPGASLEVFAALFEDACLIDWHLAPDRFLAAGLPSPTSDRAAGSRIVFAGRKLILPEQAWPDWAADRGAPGGVIEAGWPICTVTASADKLSTVRSRLALRRREILRHLRGDSRLMVAGSPLKEPAGNGPHR